MLFPFHFKPRRAGGGRFVSVSLSTVSFTLGAAGDEESPGQGTGRWQGSVTHLSDEDSF